MNEIIALDELVEQAARLEPLPPSATRLAGIVASDDPDLNEIVDVVSYDPALTARLLRVANSAASGSRHPIGTVRQAVIRMGIGSVLSVTMAGSVRGRMDVALPEYRLAEGEFWRHAVASAVAAETLAAASRDGVPPESFTAALLHDVGKLVLARHLDGEVLRFLDRAIGEGGRSPREAETELLGVHHGELGGLIGQSWELPHSIVIGITHHHDPEAGNSRVCDVVCVSNLIAKRVLRDAAEQPATPAESEAAERLALVLDLDEIARRSTERFADVIAQYSG